MNIPTFARRGLAILSLSVLGLAACDKKDTIIEFPDEDVVVTVSPASMTLEQGSTGTLIAVVTGDTNQNVTWASSNTAVATVSNAGVVTAVAPGTATITATSAADGNARGAALVTVTPRQTGQVTITLAPTTATINPNGTVQLVGVVSGSTNTAITYRSSTPAVATVNASGLVTGVAPGTAIITALAQADTTKRVTATITVAALNTQVAITPTVASVGVGGTQQFVATVSGNPNTAVTFRTSNPAVATVTNAGIATGVAAGTAVITAVSVADTLARATATLTVVGASVAISTVPTTPQTAGSFIIQANVSVPAGTADSLMIQLTNTTTGVVYTMRCQTFTAAGAATTVNCPINPADIDPNTAGAQILPNGSYNVQAILLRQNQVAATATWAQPLVTNYQNTIAGAIVFDNTLVDNDNASDNPTDVGANPAPGTVWYGGSATLTLSPSIFSGNAVATVDVLLDLNCNLVDDGAAEPVRSVTVTGGTGTVAFSEANTTAATTPGIDNVESVGVCFVLQNPRDAQGVTVQLAPAGAGTGAVVTAGTTLVPTPGASQNQFNIDNVEPAQPVAAMTLDAADFDGLTTNAFLGTNSSLTATGTNPTVLNAIGADAGVGNTSIIYYAVPAASFDGTSQTTLRASAAAGTVFTSPTQLAETLEDDDYVLVVEVRDALGNRYFRGNAANLSFGVDLTAPTIAVYTTGGVSAPADAINPTVPQIRFAVTDANSGAEGIRGTIYGRSIYEVDGNIDEDVRCYPFNGGATYAPNSSGVCAQTNQTAIVGTVDVTTELYDAVIPVDENFYVFTVEAFDAAGNSSSTQITRNVLRDVTAGPDAVAALPVVSINSYTIDNVNNTATVNGVIRDNIDVASYDARFRFPLLATVPDEVPFTMPTTVGAYGLPLLGSQTVTATTQVNVDAIHATPAGASITPDQFGFGMTDVAGNFAFGGVAIPAGTTDGFAAGFTVFELLENPTTIDRTPPTGGSVSTTITARATTGPGDANPFAGGQVYFYWVNPGGDFTYGTADDSNVLLAIVPAGTVSIATGETARTYGWTTTLSAMNVPVLPAGFGLQVFAIGVAADGDAVTTEVDVVTVNQ